MTQQTPPPEGGAAVTDASVNTVPPELQALMDSIKANPQTVAEEMKTLRAEAKQRRLDATKAESDRQAAEAARLEADAKWQEAAQAYKKQLDDLAPKAQRVDAADQFLKDMAARRIAALPKQFQALVPEYDDPLKTLAWLEANAATLSLPNPPPMGQGDQSDKAIKTVELTPAQKQMAKNLKMTEEKYAAELRKETPRRS